MLVRQASEHVSRKAGDQLHLTFIKLRQIASIHFQHYLTFEAEGRF